MSDDLRAAPCPHPDSWFDRTICAVDDWMHTRCTECGHALDGECAATPSLDEAWKAVERALPEGAAMVRLTWNIGMHERFPETDDFEARIEQWSGKGQVYLGYGPTPEAALTDLLRKLEDAS